MIVPSDDTQDRRQRFVLEKEKYRKMMHCD